MIVNGKQCTQTGEVSVSDLLRERGMQAQRVAVEVKVISSRCAGTPKRCSETAIASKSSPSFKEAEDGYPGSSERRCGTT
ncbi:hypothetical protein [Bifidobacterium crudilactis]|uniref:hypothetical protein n=1 Tax=Bifidobacterium crudilactis TaxID=327277 RepID=UPI003D80F6C1